MTQFISPITYAKLHNLSKDDVYNAIRRGKFGEDDVKIEGISRYRIKRDAKFIKKNK